MKFKSRFLLLLLAIVAFSCTENTTKVNPKAIEGIIDLRSWDFQKDGNINLDGEWEFYWKQLLEPKDFKSQKPKAEYVNVRGFGTWLQGSVRKKKYTSFGYATYRLKVILPKMQELAKVDFKLFNLFTSSKLWLNDNMIFEIGKVGTSLATYQGEFCVYRNLLDKQNYTLKNDTLEIVVQSSDFSWGKGGLRGCKIGLAEQIHASINTKIIYDSIILGILLIVGIYHLFLFSLRSEEYSTLFFGLLSLLIFLRALAVTGFTFKLFSFELSLRLIYLWIPLYPILLTYFLSSIYSQESNKKITKVIVIANILLFLVYLFIPIQLLKTSEIVLALLTTLPIFYLLLFVNTKAIRKKRQGAWLSFFGLILLIIGTINDILFAKGVLFSLNFSIMQFTFTLYIILQSINIAERFSLAFTNNIKLNKELDYQNKNLGEIVGKRTEKVQQQQEEILVQNEELRQQQEEVLVINENLEKQKLELQEKNTAITDSIRYAKTIQKAMLPSKNYREKIFPQNFVLYRPKDIVSGDFFWIIEHEKKSFIACVDCTGHGVPGAFMSMIGHSLLNDAIDHKHYSTPSQILNHLNEKIRTRLDQKESRNSDGMDISICSFEKIDGKTKLTYAGAKSTIYLIKNNEIITLKGDRKSIGDRKYKLGFSFQNFEQELEEGDMIYMASDGYIDQSNEERKRFGSQRFKELIQNNYNKSIEEQKEEFEKELDKYQGNQKQRDDITVIGIRI